MSAMLAVLVASGLLGFAWSLCFVGCDPPFPVSGPIPYSNIILAEPGLIAYWPLNDLPGSPPPPPFPPTPTNSISLGTANDLSGQNHVGSYLVPPDYPASPVDMSAPITNAILTLRSPLGPIVPGDAGSGDQNTSPACTDFEGGYVSIPWNTQTSSSPRLDTFTLEAWIAPQVTPPQNSKLQSWTAGTNGNIVHVLFGALAGDGTGFAIAVDQTNALQIRVGSEPLSPTGVTINPMNVMYVAVSFDGSAFSVFVQGADDASPRTSPAISGAAYTATAAGTPVTFFIGAGGNDQLPRMTAGDTTGAPMNPFMGLIQSVALYSPDLDSGDIQSHFAIGAGG